MTGIEAISSRILEIRTTIAAISRPSAAATAATTAPRPGQATTSTQFDAVLAQATALTSGSTAASALGGLGGPGGLGATTATSGARLNASGIPEDLAAYGNGKVPRDALAPVGDTGHRLWAPASASFERLLSAAKADGVTIGITDSYRTYESQVDLAARKGLYSQGGLAAKPGTSDHGWGLSVDLRLDGPALAWMRANGASHGFVEDVPREPWHWTFQG